MPIRIPCRQERIMVELTSNDHKFEICPQCHQKIKLEDPIWIMIAGEPVYLYAYMHPHTLKIMTRFDRKRDRRTA